MQGGGAATGASPRRTRPVQRSRAPEPTSRDQHRPTSTKGIRGGLHGAAGARPALTHAGRRGAAPHCRPYVDLPLHASDWNEITRRFSASDEACRTTVGLLGPLDPQNGGVSVSARQTRSMPFARKAERGRSSTTRMACGPQLVPNARTASWERSCRHKRVGPRESSVATSAGLEGTGAQLRPGLALRDEFLAC